MLSTFRKYSRSVSGLLVVAMSVLLMASFGLDYYQNAPKRQAALTVNGTEISFEQYRRAYDNLLRMTRSPDRAREIAEDSLINETLFTQFSDKLGLTAASSQIEAKILENPYFGGQYTPERFRSFLQSAGLTSGQLKSLISSEIVNDQLRAATRDLSWLSDAELQAVYNQQKATYDFRYLQLKSSDFEPQVTVTDEAKLRQFYDEHQESYRKPRTASYTFLRFRPEAFLDKVEITEADLKDLYEGDSVPAVFEPKRVHLKKIVFEKSKDKESPLPFQDQAAPKDDAAAKDSAQSKVDSNEARKTRATDIAKRLKDNDSFDKVAAELTADASAGGKVEDAGFVEEKSLDPLQRRAVEKLDIGESTKMLDLPESYTILYVADIKPESKRAFEEVRPALEAYFREENSPSYAHAAAEELFAFWTDEKNSERPLADVAKEKGFEAQSTGRLMPESEDPKDAEGLTALALKLSQGDKDLVELDGESVLLHVTEIKERYIPPFEETRAQVEAEYRREQAKVLARALGEELLKETGVTEAAAPKKSLGDVAKSKTREVKELTGVTRSTAAGDLFTSADLRNAAFNLTPEAPLANKVFDSADSFYLVELVQRKLPNPADFPKEKAELFKSERERSGQRVFSALRARLRDDAEIVKNPTLGRP